MVICDFSAVHDKFATTAKAKHAGTAVSLIFGNRPSVQAECYTPSAEGYTGLKAGNRAAVHVKGASC